MGVILLYGSNQPLNQWLFPRYGGYSMQEPFCAVLAKLFPRYGGYSEKLFNSTKNVGLFPRYGGGYSEVFTLKYFAQASCFPVMGVIPTIMQRGRSISWLFPRYGGYSARMDRVNNPDEVVSPLWGVIPNPLST